MPNLHFSPGQQRGHLFARGKGDEWEKSSLLKRNEEEGRGSGELAPPSYIFLAVPMSEREEENISRPCSITPFCSKSFLCLCCCEQALINANDTVAVSKQFDRDGIHYFFAFFGMAITCRRRHLVVRRPPSKKYGDEHDGRADRGDKCIGAQATLSLSPCPNNVRRALLLPH